MKQFRINGSIYPEVVDLILIVGLWLVAYSQCQFHEYALVIQGLLCLLAGALMLRRVYTIVDKCLVEEEHVKPHFERSPGKDKEVGCIRLF